MKNKKHISPLILLILLAGCSAEQDTPVEKAEPEVVPKPMVDNFEVSAEDIAAAEAKEAAVLVADGVSGPLEFSLTNLDGKIVKASDYRDKWLVLNYWATWCAPCRDEMPELVQFQKDYDNVQILGIAFEDAEVEKLKNFAADFNINYPLLTLDIYNPPAFAEEGGLGLPTTIIYNSEGMRHKKHMGPIDAEGLAEMLE